jgi:hypothetical protein
VAVDGAGNVFVADSGLGLIRKVSSGGVVTLVAGTLTPGFSGDGGPATSAQITATDVAVDSAGNLFIAGGAVVRKVNTAGVIATVAGIAGNAGFGGDGGLATAARITANSVTTDESGNLFIAGDSVVRKVTPQGVISTVAGNGVLAPSGTPQNPPPGPRGAGIRGGLAAGFSGDGGPATMAQLNHGLAVALDRSGNLFIADRRNQRIRKVTANGIIVTVAGSVTTHCGGRGFETGCGNSLGLDFGFFDGASGGDGGPAIAAQLYMPSGVAVDAVGNMFIADTYNHRIRRVAPDGVITTIAGNLAPSVVTRSQVTSLAGTTVEVQPRPPAGSYGGDGGPATSALFNRPSRVAVDAGGNLFIADTGNNRLRKITPNGVVNTIPTAIAGFGQPAGDDRGSPSRRASFVDDSMPGTFPAAVIALVSLLLGLRLNGRSGARKKGEAGPES